MTRLIRFIRLTCFALSVTGPIAAQAQGVPGAEQANPSLPAVQLQAGMHLIRAEVAADVGTRARGLMFRETLGPNQGMLFIFQERATQCFWMRNTRIPLSAAFLDDSGQIVNIADMQPFSEQSHCSGKPVRYVLEMEQGWFARKALKVGSRLSGPAGMFKAD